MMIHGTVGARRCRAGSRTALQGLRQHGLLQTADEAAPRSAEDYWSGE
jgi:hypothetical protein